MGVMSRANIAYQAEILYEGSPDSRLTLYERTQGGFGFNSSYCSFRVLNLVFFWRRKTGKLAITFFVS
jgi:hypothetical protein